jgi:predicted RNase H-like nuclease (RuvC/YqgF family)
MLPLEDRVAALLARHRSNRSLPTREEVEDLYTDGCAEVLELEVRCLRVERSLRAAEHDAALEKRGTQRIASLSTELEELKRRRGELRAKLRQLRAAIEWHGDESSEDVRHTA